MKRLVVYYSKTGNTKKVGDFIANELNTDVEEIVDKKDRKGILGYVTSGRDGMRRKLTQINPIDKEIHEYDVIIIGTPVWGWNMAPAIRTFLSENHFEGKKLYFYCTMQGNAGKTIGEMKSLAKGANFGETFEIKTDQINNNEYQRIIKNVIEKNN